MKLLLVASWEEVRQYAHVGVERRISGLKDGRQPAYGIKAGAQWNEDIEGAGGEMMAAKALGLFWSGTIGVVRAPDLEGYAQRIEVRTTPYRDGHLLLHPNDPDNAVCILVVGSTPRFELKGWILAKDGKLKEYWGELKGQEGRPAFLVQQAALRPFPIVAAAPSPPRAADGPITRGGYSVVIGAWRVPRYGRTGFATRGRPPLRPLAWAAATLASDATCPPCRPIVAASTGVRLRGTGHHLEADGAERETLAEGVADALLDADILVEERRVVFGGNLQRVNRREHAEAAGQPRHAQVVGAVVAGAGGPDARPHLCRRSTGEMGSHRSTCLRLLVTRLSRPKGDLLGACRSTRRRGCPGSSECARRARLAWRTSAARRVMSGAT